MDLIRFDCPKCGNPIDVPAHFAGKRGACDSCGAVLTIPGAPEPPAPVPQLAAAPAPPQPGGRPARPEPAALDDDLGADPALAQFSAQAILAPSTHKPHAQPIPRSASRAVLITASAVSFVAGLCVGMLIMLSRAGPTTPPAPEPQPGTSGPQKAQAKAPELSAEQQARRIKLLRDGFVTLADYRDCFPQFRERETHGVDGEGWPTHTWTWGQAGEKVTLCEKDGAVRRIEIVLNPEHPVDGPIGLSLLTLLVDAKSKATFDIQDLKLWLDMNHKTPGARRLFGDVFLEILEVNVINNSPQPKVKIQ